MKENLKKYHKLLAMALALLALFAAYQLMFGQAKKAANNLVAEIEDLKGNAFKKKFDDFILARYSKFSANMNPEEKIKYLGQIKSELQKTEVDFDYADISTKTEDGKGYAVIKSPVIIINDGQRAQKAEFKLGALEIGRDGSDPDHYFYSSTGELEIALEQNGIKQKALGIAFTNLKGEFKSDEKTKNIYSKFEANNLGVIEGRGNTTLFKIAYVYQEQEIKNLPNNKISSSAKAEYKDIEGGDLFKLMFGPVPPLTIRADYNFEGDDPVAAYGKFAGMAPAMLPGTTPAPATAQAASFDGKFKLNNFEIAINNAAIKAISDLEFKKLDPDFMPYGTVKLSLVNYNNLKDFFATTLHIPAEKMQNAEDFIKEIAQPENNDYVFNIVFDDSPIVKINDKTYDEVNEVYRKYFPANLNSSSADGVIPAALPQVQQKPLK